MVRNRHGNKGKGLILSLLIFPDHFDHFLIVLREYVGPYGEVPSLLILSFLAADGLEARAQSPFHRSEDPTTGAYYFRDPFYSSAAVALLAPQALLPLLRDAFFLYFPLFCVEGL